MIPSLAKQLKYFDPYKEIWNNLFAFTNIAVAKEVLQNKHKIMGKEFLKRKALDIRRALIQAKEYFDAANNVTILTKPTLIYYGTISLVVALIIILKRDKSLDSIAHSHGLEMIYDTRSTQSDQILKESKVKIGSRGGFAELIDVPLADRISINWEVSGLTSSSKSFKNEYLVNSKFTGKEINLFDLLSMVPEIWKEFYSFNNEQVYVNGEPYVLLNNTNEVLCFRFLKSSLPNKRN